jgi:hypothetical protein
MPDGIVFRPVSVTAGVLLVSAGVDGERQSPNERRSHLEWGIDEPTGHLAAGSG